MSCHYDSAHSACCGGKSGQTTESSSDQTSPTDQSTTSGTGLTLDIKKNNSTNDFERSERGNCRLFKPKGDKLFSKIVGKNGSAIWSSKDNDDAVKVLLKGKGNKKKHLALFLKSGKFLVLYRDGKGKSWTDITSSKDDVTKFKFYDDKDKELDSSNYKADIGFMFSYIVKFNDGVKCRNIKLGDKEIWKYDSDARFRNLKFFSVDFDSNDLFLMNNYGEHKRIEFTKPTTTTPSGQTGASPT
ncbi:hypothetical protein TpMuguga_04g00102 [Theileria parva strain Muguga]|uniref:Uncharacterized protein n=1 Tax=Theileria parva TaxID=5875 RepID=Q4N385_THEPA|nr:uncharacterized protein TpMuguga_04g00102 [Theileria parva strain Muguga]EAN31454.1 hypothetical protein TpMuguga_04g00102 [Theileria parva strain Muguga]|eukprot:XP_763737.1 hypothetical protein [Theileria parva strain Muguga]